MNWKFIGSLFIAICAGLIFAQSFLFVGRGVVKIATGNFSVTNQVNLSRLSFLNFKNLSYSDFRKGINEKTEMLLSNTYRKINNITNAASFGRTYTFENDDSLESIEQGGDFLFIKNENSIFINPATKLFEDFPTNDPDSINTQKYSEDLTIPQDGKAIVANLETMIVDLYQDGEILESFEILSKGRPGTAWETPPGSFEVMYKTENHFSSIGEVWLPYSMQFFGNYFIHGWPHHSDGSPVPQGYSGGCIRLDDDDARKVYEFASLGTNVIVLGTTKESIAAKQTGRYVINDSQNFPDITSNIYLVADIESGDVLFSKDAERAVPIASTTKLMTALISLETINQYRYTTVSQRAYDTEGWRGNLSPGERILTGDLIYPLLLQSSNDASEVLAEFSGRNHFISNMNLRAKSLGLENTNFADPSGLSPENVSTASDLFKLSHYIYRYKKFVFDVSQMIHYSNDNHTWPNTHRMVGEEIFLGGKNGFTDEARHTLITLVDLPISFINLSENPEEAEDDYLYESKYTNRKFAIILLQAETTNEDTRKIVNFIQNNVEYREE